MSIDRIRYFAAVVETRNLRRAAEMVGISAPSMSKAIAVLEHELGHKLIHPEGRGIGITPKGLDIYQNSLALLTEYQHFHQRLKRDDLGPRPVRMATFEVFSTYFIADFLQQESKMQMALLERTPGEIERAVLAGTVDYGITYIPSLDPAIEYREIGSFAMGIYGLIRYRNIDFAQWPFAVPTTELKIHTSEIDALDMWPKGAPQRLIKYRFELLETALQTARRGLSVLHCPDFVVELYNEQVKNADQLIELPKPRGYRNQKARMVYLLSRKGTEDQRLSNKLAKFMRRLAQFSN